MPRTALQRLPQLLAIVLSLMLVTGCTRTPLYSDLNEQQANELMAALLGAGITAEKSSSPKQQTWEIRVAGSDIPQAMQVLNAQGLPRVQYRSLGDVFKKEGFASSALEEKARYLYGLSQELSHTLSRIDGVVEARVHIALPERDPLGTQTQDSSASVILFERPGANLRSRETDIKVFVKDSVEGLDDVNKVTVKFFPIGSAVPTHSISPVRMAVASISPAAVLATLALLALGAIGLRLRHRVRPLPAAAAASQAPAWKD